MALSVDAAPCHVLTEETLYSKFERKPRKTAYGDHNYVLLQEFEVPGIMGQSEILAASTNKEMIFEKAKRLAREERFKPNDSGQWVYIILVFHNPSGEPFAKFKVEDPEHIVPVSLG